METSESFASWKRSYLYLLTLHSFLGKLESEQFEDAQVWKNRTLWLWSLGEMAAATPAQTQVFCFFWKKMPRRQTFMPLLPLKQDKQEYVWSSENLEHLSHRGLFSPLQHCWHQRVPRLRGTRDHSILGRPTSWVFIVLISSQAL